MLVRDPRRDRRARRNPARMRRAGRRRRPALDVARPAPRRPARCLSACGWRSPGRRRWKAGGSRTRRARSATTFLARPDDDTFRRGRTSAVPTDAPRCPPGPPRPPRALGWRLAAGRRLGRQLHGAEGGVHGAVAGRLPVRALPDHAGRGGGAAVLALRRGAGRGSRAPTCFALLRLGLAGHLLHVGLVTYGIHWSTAFSSSLILACGPIFTLLILRWHGHRAADARPGRRRRGRLRRACSPSCPTSCSAAIGRPAAAT